MDMNTNILQDTFLAEVPVHEHYKILDPVMLYSKLSKGAMGAVYIGRHLRLNIDVSVKVMTPPPWLEPDALDVFINRFAREAQTAAGIIHQNLVHVFDVNIKHGLNYLIMEYVDGETVEERLKRKESLHELEAIEIITETAKGLAEAHSKEIVHRDIKPDNIMISRSGNIKVMDLGLAKAVNNNGNRKKELTVVGTIMGTPYFMSPEQTSSAKDVGPESDVWSLGITLYKLLSNSLPFQASDLADLIYNIRKSPMPDIRKYNPNLSNKTCGIISKCLEKDQSKRYKNCIVMGEDLDHCLRLLRKKSNPEIYSYKISKIPKKKQSPPPEQSTISKVVKILRITSHSSPSRDAEKKGPNTKTSTEVDSEKKSSKISDAKLFSLGKEIKRLSSRFDDQKFNQYANPKNKLHIRNILKQAGSLIKKSDYYQAKSNIATANKLLNTEQLQIEKSIKKRNLIIANLVLVFAAIIIPLIIFLVL